MPNVIEKSIEARSSLTSNSPAPQIPTSTNHGRLRLLEAPEQNLHVVFHMMGPAAHVTPALCSPLQDLYSQQRECVIRVRRWRWRGGEVEVIWVAVNACTSKQQLKTTNLIPGLPRGSGRSRNQRRGTPGHGAAQPGERRRDGSR